MSSIIVTPGDVWEFGPHTLFCGDVEEERCVTAYTAVKPDVTFSNPPWGQSLSTGYRNQSNKDYRDRYGTGVDAWPKHTVDFNFILRQGIRIFSHTQGSCFVLMGYEGRYAKDLQYLLSVMDQAGAQALERWECIYLDNKKLRCYLTRFSWHGPDNWTGGDDKTRITGVSEFKIPHSIMPHYPPGTLVSDPFMGFGSTTKAALDNDLTFMGMEINPLRVAAVLETMAEYPSLQDHKPRRVANVFQ